MFTDFGRHCNCLLLGLPFPGALSRFRTTGQAHDGFPAARALSWKRWKRRSWKSTESTHFTPSLSFTESLKSWVLRTSTSQAYTANSAGPLPPVACTSSPASDATNWWFFSFFTKKGWEVLDLEEIGGREEFRFSFQGALEPAWDKADRSGCNFEDASISLVDSSALSLSTINFPNLSLSKSNMSQSTFKHFWHSWS